MVVVVVDVVGAAPENAVGEAVAVTGEEAALETRKTAPEAVVETAHKRRADPSRRKEKGAGAVRAATNICRVPLAVYMDQSRCGFVLNCICTCVFVSFFYDTSFTNEIRSMLNTYK